MNLCISCSLSSTAYVIYWGRKESTSLGQHDSLWNCPFYLPPPLPKTVQPTSLKPSKVFLCWRILQLTDIYSINYTFILQPNPAWNNIPVSSGNYWQVFKFLSRHIWQSCIIFNLSGENTLDRELHMKNRNRLIPLLKTAIFSQKSLHRNWAVTLTVAHCKKLKWKHILKSELITNCGEVRSLLFTSRGQS